MKKKEQAIRRPDSRPPPAATGATAFLRRHDVVVASVVVLFWIAATAGLRPLLLPDEGRYAGVAWEMLRSGDWLTPTLDGLPFFHKPPLFYWITAASLSVFGMTEWAARAAPMVGGWLGAMAAYVFVRRWVGRRAARLTLIVLLAQPLFFAGAQYANLDMLVAGCIAATILLFAHAALQVEHGLPCHRTLVLAYAAAALGVLAKGLIGFVLPMFVLLPWIAAYRGRHLLRRLLWLPGIAVFFVLATPWFAAMQLRFAGFFDAFFVEQHFRRFAQAGFNNPQPFWFFPAVLLVASLPWWPWLFKAVRRRGFFAAEPGRVRLLMLIWIAVVTVFFSLPKSKLVGYIFPTLVPLAFFAADGYASLGKPSAAARRYWWLSAAIGVVLGLTALIVYTVRPVRTSRPLALALAAERNPGEPVVMLNRYDYDVPFYARLREPIRVVSDWSDPDLYQRDDWRKELAEAGRFAPVQSAALFLSTASLPIVLCESPVTWMIGDSDAGRMYPFLEEASTVFSQRGKTIWRIDTKGSAMAAALSCAQGSGVSADSAFKQKRAP